MTTLAAGSSVTVAVRDGGTVAIATNGGLASAVVSPTEGGTIPVSLGPLTERRTLGPYAEGATIVITNSSCGAFDYDVETRNDPSSVAITGGTINVWPSRLVGLLGDSRTASSLINTSTNASITHDWFPVANALIGSPFKIAYFGGVSGDTTAQVAVRVSTLIASGAKYCCLLCGTNDGWTTQAGVDASIATRRAMLAQLSAAGVYVFGLSELPNTTKGTAWHDLAVYFNKQERDYWTGRTDGEFVDVFGALLDSTVGTGLAANFHDGLHPDIAGTYLMANVLAPRLKRFHPQGVQPYRPLVSSMRDYVVTNALSVNRQPNSLMLGTGGTLNTGNTGTLPNSYSGRSGSAASAYSIVARADGVGNDVKIVVSGATSGQTATLDCIMPNFADFVVGSTWVLRAEVTIESCTTLNRCSVSVSTDKWQFGSLTPIQPLGSLTLSSPVTMTLESPEFTVGAGLNPVSFARTQFDLAGPTGSGWSAAVRFGRCSVERAS